MELNGTPHELLPRHQRHNSNFRGLLVDFVPIDAQISPRPPIATNLGGMDFAALSIVTRLSRDGDGLDRFRYSVGIGLSWKPIAVAFRWSALTRLALILASYSSIDWVTYSSPCLSIL